MPAKLRGLIRLSCLLSGLLAPAAALAADVSIPIVMPITGFMSVEGGSQRNGALLALERAPAGVKVKNEVYDTGTMPTVEAP